MNKKILQFGLSLIQASWSRFNFEIASLANENDEIYECVEAIDDSLARLDRLIQKL